MYNVYSIDYTNRINSLEENSCEPNNLELYKKTTFN